MNSSIYKEVQREFDLKRQKAIIESDIRKQKLIENEPKFKELIEKKNSIALKYSKEVLTRSGIERQIAKENLEIKLKEVEKEISQYMNSIDLPDDYLKPKYECKRCNDTGYINDEIRCNCFTQRIVNLTYKQNNMLRLKDENFNTFDIAFFSNKVDRQKYNSDKSPLENIEDIKKIAQSFCHNITDPKQKNLLFVGKAGTGKTFMSSCIANEAVNSGYTVLYQTAPLLMDMIIEAKFSSLKDEFKKEQYERVFDVDLLIIDDLGTENINNMKFTELFNIINTRLLKNKKTIISTNLTLSDLATEYDDRVMSRLIGNYTICKFFGDDIRIKIKKMN